MKHSLLAALTAAPILALVAAVGFAEKPADAPDRTDVVRGDTQFALDLYAKLRGQDGNLFFSPYSISTALAMTRAGARGETAEQMDKVLHFTLPQDKLNPAFARPHPGNQRRPHRREETRLSAQHRQRPLGAEGLRLQGRLHPAARRRLRRRPPGAGLQDRPRGGPQDDQRLGGEAD